MRSLRMTEREEQLGARRGELELETDDGEHIQGRICASPSSITLPDPF